MRRWRPLPLWLVALIPRWAGPRPNRIFYRAWLALPLTRLMQLKALGYTGLVLRRGWAPLRVDFRTRPNKLAYQVRGFTETSASEPATSRMLGWGLSWLERILLAAWGQRRSTTG